MKVVKRKKGFKESWRKFIVSLKKKPQNIPLAVLAITFLEYSLNMTLISNATAIINKNPMGLCCFCVMLFSALSFVCFFNSFPKRQKIKLPMFILLFVMLILMVVCDVAYIIKIGEGIAGLEMTAERMFIYDCRIVLIIHIILLVVSIILFATIKIYGKLLNKIDTSIELGENADMKEIDFTE